MNLLLAILTGVLFGSGVYMLLRRSFIKVIIGIILLGHGANILIFTIGRLNLANPAIIEEGKKSIDFNASEPLTQALILTAIVIGFGLQAFLLVLIKKTYLILNKDDINSLKITDKID